MSVEIKLSSEELETLKSFYYLRDVSLRDKEYETCKFKVIEMLATSYLASMYGGFLSASGVEKASEILRGSGTSYEKVLANSIAIAILMGYLQGLNNDVADKEIVDFGFNDMGMFFRSTMLDNAKLIGDKVNGRLEDGFNIKIRDITPDEYFSQGLYHDDIKFLSDFLDIDIDDGYNKKVKTALAGIDDIDTSIDSYMVDLKAIYTLALEGSFGIKPYRGVLSSDNTFLSLQKLNDTEDMHSVRITEGESTLNLFASRVHKRIDSQIKFSDARQFDYREIFESNAPVYFPRKILEYISGRESTLNMNKDVYRPNAYCSSWEEYSEHYVYPNLREILLRGTYKALEKILIERGIILSEFITLDFISDIQKLGYADCESFIKAKIKDQQIFIPVKAYLAKIVKSASCLFILTKYPYLARKIGAIYLRVVFPSNLSIFRGVVSESEALFKDLVAVNASQTFSEPFDLAGERKSAMSIELSAKVYEYGYEVNPLLTKAEPLFGYIIQRQNQKRGVASSWNRILIGESYTNKELYSTEGGDIFLQQNFIHNIIAGSRSGKGVMTMNILVSALASGKPIFYLDRKPDMASMLYGISHGKQFIVNGGLYQSVHDTYNVFGQSGSNALEKWTNTEDYLNRHKKILELFGVSSTSYEGLLGDYVYFRAFMFVVGIMVLRTKLAGIDDKLRNELFNGNRGIVLVVDELYGFQGGIQSLFGTFSLMVKKSVEIGNTDEILAKKEDLENKIRVQQAKINESQKESARIEAESKIAGLKRELDALTDEQALYASTLYKKIYDSYITLLDQKVAGFKNKEFTYSDIFVLGQVLSANYYASSLDKPNKGVVNQSAFFPITSKRDSFYAAYNGADIVRSFLEEFGDGDWFLGRNPDYNYGNKEACPKAKEVLDEDGNWGYIGKHSCDTVRSGDGEFNYVYFKPYLVLNEHYENNPPTSDEGDKKYQFVSQCANRVNENAGNIDMWSTVRLKHIRQDLKDKVSLENPMYDSLDEGIGFKGLVRDTLLTTKEGKQYADDIESYISKCLSKSGDIANYVAKKMGNYSSWQELIFDLSPSGLFSFDDIVNAVINEKDYTIENRFPIYAKLGALDLLGVDREDSENSELGGDSEPSNMSISDFDNLGGSNEETSQPSGVSVEPEPEIEPEENTDSIYSEFNFGDDEPEPAEEPVQEPQMEDDYGDDDETSTKWTDGDRQMVAGLMTEAYVQGLTASGDKNAERYALPVVRQAIQEKFYSLLLKYGY